jgi:hypothetical protein
MPTAFDHDTYPGENTAILTPAPVEDMFGFYGTMKTIVSDAMAAQLWETASLTLSTFFREDDPAVVRNFLRSANGRHLADDVTFFAKPEEYDDPDVMHAAVHDAVMHTDSKGRSFWGTRFAEVKEYTERGEWED